MEEHREIHGSGVILQCHCRQPAQAGHGRIEPERIFQQVGESVVIVIKREHRIASAQPKAGDVIVRPGGGGEREGLHGVRRHGVARGHGDTREAPRPAGRGRSGQNTCGGKPEARRQCAGHAEGWRRVSGGGEGEAIRRSHNHRRRRRSVNDGGGLIGHALANRCSRERDAVDPNSGRAGCDCAAVGGGAPFQLDVLPGRRGGQVDRRSDVSRGGGGAAGEPAPSQAPREWTAETGRNRPGVTASGKGVAARCDIGECSSVDADFKHHSVVAGRADGGTCLHVKKVAEGQGASASRDDDSGRDQLGVADGGHIRSKGVVRGAVWVSGRSHPGRLATSGSGGPASGQTGRTDAIERFAKDRAIGEGAQTQRVGDGAEIGRPILEGKRESDVVSAGAGCDETERTGNGRSAGHDDAVSLRSARVRNSAGGLQGADEVGRVPSARVHEREVDRNILARVRGVVRRSEILPGESGRAAGSDDRAWTRRGCRRGSRSAATESAVQDFDGINSPSRYTNAGVRSHAEAQFDRLSHDVRPEVSHGSKVAARATAPRLSSGNRTAEQGANRSVITAAGETASDRCIGNVGECPRINVG